jgi:hypothetical protein
MQTPVKTDNFIYVSKDQKKLIMFSDESKVNLSILMENALHCDFNLIASK